MAADGTRSQIRVGRFSTEPALEAILLTSDGSKNTTIQGIITQWDAARYA